MYFLVFIVLAILVYVFTFKQDFNPENMSKASPFIIVLILLLIMMLLLSAR